MSEYLIEVQEYGEATHVVIVNIKNRKEHTLTVASADGYLHCTKFKNKGTATKLASKIPNAVVVPSYGGYVRSTKSSVAPLANKVNGSVPYRSI